MTRGGMFWTRGQTDCHGRTDSLTHRQSAVITGKGDK
jgi:hypothetical protein